MVCRSFLFLFFLFFFFKQKTAYEMRISDWSSDVCSSDLQHSQSSAVSTKPNCISQPGCHQGHAGGRSKTKFATTVRNRQSLSDSISRGEQLSDVRDRKSVV